MNRRQKKKQFKKKYGMNPAQYQKWLNSKLPKTNAEAFQAAGVAIQRGFKALGDAAVKAAAVFSEGMNRWAEEVRTAAGFIETEELLRKSELLPEGVDIELLKPLGIRMDRYSGAYKFYYDEANDAYFVEILQEGGTNNADNDADA